MTSFVPDTNVLIAIVQDWHPHHDAALTEFRRRLERGEELILVAHSLIECFSVLTRMPPPHRISADAALEAIEDLFLRRGTVIALEAEEVVELLRSAPDRGMSGGRIFDAAIARTAQVGAADVFLTFNSRHFPSIGPMQILEPRL